MTGMISTTGRETGEHRAMPGKNAEPSIRARLQRRRKKTFEVELHREETNRRPGPGHRSRRPSLGSSRSPRLRTPSATVLRGRGVAVGIPGASAISAVGKFLPGGPIHDKPELAADVSAGKDPAMARALKILSQRMASQ